MEQIMPQDLKIEKVAKKWRGCFTIPSPFTTNKKMEVTVWGNSREELETKIEDFLARNK